MTAHRGRMCAAVSEYLNTLPKDDANQVFEHYVVFVLVICFLVAVLLHNATGSDGDKVVVQVRVAIAGDAAYLGFSI